MTNEVNDSSPRWDEIQTGRRTCDAWDAGDIGCGEVVLTLRTRLLKRAFGLSSPWAHERPGASKTAFPRRAWERGRCTGEDVKQAV
jgi:hypothetical protein